MDISAWLRELGLERYEQAFRENAIGPDVLAQLTDEHLKDLGLPLGDRLRLLKAIALIGARPEPPVESEPSAPTDAAATAGPGGAERRQLTVMFCDLVGSTALSAVLDPEDMREVIRAYQDACAGVITRFEGFVAKYMGDGVLAYFGYPRAHEDEAERAVRAGLALIQAVGALRSAAGQALAARIGIATGLVVVGDLVGEGASQEQAVVGDTPNLAARLQGVAEPGQVAIAETTRRLIGARFDLEVLGPQTLRGLSEPVEAFAVTGERTVQSRFEADRGLVLPMVGRDHELALLLERWAQAKAGEGQGVLLVGEAGIGKSRISRALLDALTDEPHTRIRYQCSPYHTDSALWPVIQQLGHAAGFAAGDAAEARLDKLEALLAPADGQAIPLIADLLGLEGVARYGSLNLAPPVQRARTLEALVGQLLALAARRPVLVLLEDAHWVDPTTLEMISQALDRIADARVLIALTSRPDQQPELAGHPHVTRLTLNRLSRVGAEAIVARVGGGHLSGDVIDAIIARTDGVPLYVEELTKAVLEAGETTIPASLHDSLMARLDRIPEVKEVAQTAACIGREFPHALLATVAGKAEPELQDALDKLAAAEIVFRRGIPPDARYTFKHALVRDAAYHSLLKERRRGLHRRLADHLEWQAGRAEAVDASLLAHHRASAGQATEAMSWYRIAGQRAFERSANAEAIGHFRAALDALAEVPDLPDAHSLQLDLLLSLGKATVAASSYASVEAGEAFRQARLLCDPRTDPERLLQVSNGEFLFESNRGHFDAAEVVARDELALGDSGVADAELFGLRHLALCQTHRGRLAEAHSSLQRLARVGETRDPSELAALGLRYGYDPYATGLCQYGFVLVVRGYPEQAAAVVESTLEIAEQLEHRHSYALALVAAILADWMAGRVELQLERARVTRALAEELGFEYMRVLALMLEASAMARIGSEPTARSLAEQGFSAWEATRSTIGRPLWTGLVGEVLDCCGNPDGAATRLAEADRDADRTGQYLYQPEIRRLAAGLALKRGDKAGAETRLHNALTGARAMEARLFELRAARDLALLWADQGGRRRALDLLAPIYGWFTEGFDTPDLKDAKTLLDKLA